MVNFVALLRGINVNGVKIEMVKLQQAFESIGLQNVKTVLATGNVVFQTDRLDKVELKEEIERMLCEVFSYEAWIVLIGEKEVMEMVQQYPFDETNKDRNPYLIFSADSEVLKMLSKLPFDQVEERIQLGNSVLYWYVKKGETLSSPFGKEIGKSKYKPYITSRNIRTMHKVLKLF